EKRHDDDATADAEQPRAQPGERAAGDEQRRVDEELRDQQATTAAPSQRGSDAPSSVPFACRTSAPAWPITESYGSTTSTSCRRLRRPSISGSGKRASILSRAECAPHVRPITRRGSASARSSGRPWIA